MQLQYRFKPQPVVAVQFIGGEESAKEVIAFSNGLVNVAFAYGENSFATLEFGQVSISMGSWLVRTEAGIYHVFADMNFKATFEAI